MEKHIANNLEKLRSLKPLVHHITNYVTVNECANITLQVGALPVMADAPEEVEEMVAISGALVLNIGTLNSGLIQAMIMAGKKANQLGIPVVLDPVGAGATGLRTDSVWAILNQVRVEVLKGNSAEIGFLAGLNAEVRGVEAGKVAGDLIKAARDLADRLQNVVVITGVEDLVISSFRMATIGNGHSFLGRITGTGCMCTSTIGAFAAVVEDKFEAAVSALVCYGVAGELAALGEIKGPFSYRTAFFDSVANLTTENIMKMARVKII